MRAATLLVLLLVATPAWCAIYKWTDDQGHVHYSDAAVAGAQAAELQPITFTGMPIIGDLTGTADATPRLRMYGAPWCAVCKRAKQWLASHNVAYDYVDVEASAAARAELKRLGVNAYPFFVAGRRTMLGFSEGGMSQLLGAH